MPTIACPGCKKQYKLPASAAGRVATCQACGKKFRIGGATTKAAPQKSAAKTAPATKAAAPSSTVADDDFWDDTLPDQIVAPSPPTPATPSPSARSPAPAAAPVNPMVDEYLSDASEEYASAQRRKQKPKWGFQWEKVAGGLGALVVGTAITIGLLLVTGRIYFLPAGIAIVGLFTMLSGLLGEEGIW